LCNLEQTWSGRHSWVGKGRDIIPIQYYSLTFICAVRQWSQNLRLHPRFSQACIEDAFFTLICWQKWQYLLWAPSSEGCEAPAVPFVLAAAPKGVGSVSASAGNSPLERVGHMCQKHRLKNRHHHHHHHHHHYHHQRQQRLFAVRIPVILRGRDAP